MKYTSTQIDTMLNHPAVKRRVAQRVRINTKYDVPGLAACSENGRTVYIDHNLYPCNYKVARDYALTKKALMDLFRLSPFLASDFAARAMLNIPRSLRPKPVGSVKNPPPDIDLKGFRIHNARLIKRRINRKKRLDTSSKIDYTRIFTIPNSRTTNVD